MAEDITYHEMGLSKLCLVCGDICDKGFCHVATDLRDMIDKVFPNFTWIRDVTPTNLCHTCYRTVTSICEGSSLRTSKVPVVWTAHSDDCYTCSLLSKNKVGGRKKKVMRFLILICKNYILFAILFL